MYYDLKGDKFCPKPSGGDLDDRVTELETEVAALDGAEPNVIEEIKVNSVTQEVVDKAVDISVPDYTDATSTEY